jgi:hypothetical protein
MKSPPKKEESPVCLAAGRGGTGKSLNANLANPISSRKPRFGGGQ